MKEKEKKPTQSQEERGARAEKKGEVANAKEEEGQHAKVTMRVVKKYAPYVDPPGDKTPRWAPTVPGRKRSKRKRRWK
jgi:hypothetical protein